MGDDIRNPLPNENIEDLINIREKYSHFRKCILFQTVYLFFLTALDLGYFEILYHTIDSHLIFSNL